MRRLTKDESGMTMGLVVIMLVLIGVMGAGLLTFVQRDLGSVVEVNQGQRALEMADVGIDAAKRHLANVDATPSNYNDNPSDGDSVWSDDRLPDGTLDPASVRNLSLNNNNVLVGVQYLPPSRTAAQASDPDRAPEVLVNGGNPADVCEDTNADGIDDDPDTEDACRYPNGRDYFRLTVRGIVGGAIRQAQAIYSTEELGFPVAYYATRDIRFNGGATVDSVSLFAERDILGLPADSLLNADRAYGDWVTSPLTGLANGYNGKPRGTNLAGAAALRDLTYSPNGGARGDNAQKNGTATPQSYGTRDFDRNSGVAPVSSKQFRFNDWNPTGPDFTAGQPNDVITFPFERNSAAADTDVLSRLKAKAEDQNHYVMAAPGDTNFRINDGTGPQDYPPSSDLNTVYFVEFATGTPDNPVYGAKGRATYQAGTTNPDGLSKGIVVVVNGDLETANSALAADFQGVLIVRDGNDSDTQFMEFVSGGNVDVEGFVNVEGDMTLSGTIGGVLPGVLAGGLPGIYDLNLWSWRECYTPTCV